MMRLWLSLLAQARGDYRVFQRPHWGRVKRLVFVCRGNICRSAYAEARARALGVPSASFGLRAVDGANADADAQRAAARRGLSLAGHRARDAAAYASVSGDLLVAMEPAQARQLAARFGRQADVQVTLLGLWCRPARPHLADPKDLEDAYFDQVCRSIDDAAATLAAAMTNRHAA